MRLMLILGACLLATLSWAADNSVRSTQQQLLYPLGPSYSQLGQMPVPGTVSPFGSTNQSLVIVPSVPIMPASPLLPVPFEPIPAPVRCYPSNPSGAMFSITCY